MKQIVYFVRKLQRMRPRPQGRLYDILYGIVCSTGGLLRIVGVPHWPREDHGYKSEGHYLH